ncbi:MAG: flagellar basal body-associated protein [Proteobacteria bacterium]|nr:flagellar basal body-associated protein [Pseudomonadota bacterium]
MTPCFPTFKYFIRFFLLAVLLQSPLTMASDGGGAAGPAPLKFLANLGDPANGGKYLQVQMVFDAASPEIEHEISVYLPKIQHALILLLSAEDASTLLTLKGKKDLMENIVQEVNHLLHQTPAKGVKEVFFTSFIIQ